jgi:sugar phosphate permease
MTDARVDALQARFSGYSMNCLYLIMGVGAIDWADRAVLAVVFDDLKAAFGVSDAALGALVAAFTFVATLSVIPCGIIADHWQRTKLIALGFVPWTIAMFWQGAATSFAMMFVARLFLGSIEATNGPSSVSLIGDYYPVERRSRVMGIWRLFDQVGTFVGFAVAGVLASAFGWRTPFFVFGALGLLCGAVVWRYLPEPERGLPDAIYEAQQRRGADPSPSEGTDWSTAGLKAAFAHLARIRTAWVMVIAASLGAFAAAGLGAWVASFLRRYHGMSAASAGATTLVFGVGALSGLLVGSRIGDWLVRKGRSRDRIKLAAVSCVIGWLLSIPGFALDATIVAVPFLVLAGFFISVPVGPTWAMWLDIIEPQLRGRADSFFTIVRVLMVAGAPWIIGVISDATSLRTSFLAVMPVVALNGLLLLPALSSYDGDASRARASALYAAGGR